MLKANTKKVFSILFSLTLVFLAGCSGPEEKRAEALMNVAQLRSIGDNTAALAALETLDRSFPNDTEILRQMASIHEALGNNAEAAFYFSVANTQAPDDIELLYQTYRAQENANQPAAAYELLEALVAADPNTISDELWLRLGEFRAQAHRTQSALDAYLKGVDPERRTPTAETAVAIGTLFKQLDNLPQAERWFQIAANSDDPNALPALFGLLEINIRNKNWTAAEVVITQLDQQFPGAVNASEWADERTALENWRKDQIAMQAELAKAQKAQAQAEEAAKIAAEATAKLAATTEKNSLSDTKTAADTVNIETEIETESKAQIITDLEHAEAMADAPAIEVESSEETIRFNPAIAIEPAEPALTFEVSYDQQGQGSTIDYSVGTSDLNDSMPVENTPIETITTIQQPITTAPATTTSQPAISPRSLEHLLADAESASLQHNYKQAIQLYWQALGLANDRADIWNQLSRAYRIDGQNKNAETTALEATRLAPQNIDYTLDYLRVIQRTKKPEDFLAELETAYDRFPRSPEVALSLARGYERISGNNSGAILLYTRFIELAPNHPLRPDAEASIRRLR
jgi:tetratricopeptide (TPR) repeat protein